MNSTSTVVLLIVRARSILCTQLCVHTHCVSVCVLAITHNTMDCPSFVIVISAGPRGCFDARPVVHTGNADNAPFDIGVLGSSCTAHRARGLPAAAALPPC
eukprot:COSAG02_NODE_35609_length_466_cov_0.659401_1_plen_100_part_01